jgi:hypothetical protein
MNNSSIRDNHKHGTVGDFLAEHLKPQSSVSIVSAFFTIYSTRSATTTTGQCFRKR